MKTIEQAANESLPSVAGLESDYTKGKEFGYLLGFNKGVAFAQRWIPLEEEKPEYAEPILIKFENGTYEVGYYLRHKYREDSFYNYESNDIEFKIDTVTHWRPIERN